MGFAEPSDDSEIQKSRVRYLLMKKPKRKQPRRLTPPLFLKGESGVRDCIEIDDQIVTMERSCTGRVSVFLTLGPDLRVQVGSRCVNKRRVTSLIISKSGDGDAINYQHAPQLQQIRETMSR